MLRKTGEFTRLVLVCAMLVALSGCSGIRGDGPLRAIVSPVIPASAQEIANPLRGQYEDMQEPLFPQSNRRRSGTLLGPIRTTPPSGCRTAITTHRSVNVGSHRSG